MSSLQSLLGLVHDLVDQMEADGFRSGFHRPLQRGSAAGAVSVLPDADADDHLLLVVRLSIMTVPTRRLDQFLATLLELNHRFQGRAAFSLDESGTVHLTAGRPVEDLDESEILDLVLWTTEQADHYDDILMDAFGS